MGILSPALLVTLPLPAPPLQHVDYWAIWALFMLRGQEPLAVKFPTLDCALVNVANIIHIEL